MSRPLPIDPARWDDGCSNDAARNDFVVPTLCQLIRDKSARRVVDVGCGSGYISRALVDYFGVDRVDMTLIDRNPEMVAFARSAAQDDDTMRFLVGEVDDLTGAGDAGKFDLCFCAYTLLEVNDIRSFGTSLKSLVDVGWLVVFVPDTFEDIVTHYLRSGEAEVPAGLEWHSVEKVNGFTGAVQTFIARQCIDYVTAILDEATSLRRVLEYQSSTAGRHFALVFERKAKDADV